MCTEDARFSLCPMIVMLDSATGRRAGLTARKVGAATTMHGDAKLRRHLSHTTAQQVSPTGQQAGLIKKSTGAACTRIEAVKRHPRRTIAMLGMPTGRMGGQPRRSSGAVSTQIGHVIRMIAKQIWFTGKSGGSLPRNSGAANTLTVVAQPPQHRCPMTVMPAMLIGMMAGRPARSSGVACTITVAVRSPQQHHSPMTAMQDIIIGRQAGLTVRNTGAVRTTTAHAISSIVRKTLGIGIVNGRHRKRFFAAIDTGADVQRPQHRSLMIVPLGTVTGKQAGRKAKKYGVAGILGVAVPPRALCRTIAMLATAIGKRAGQKVKKHGAAIIAGGGVVLHPCHMTAMLGSATIT